MSRSQSFLWPEILGLHVFCNHWRWFSVAYASYELLALPLWVLLPFSWLLMLSWRQINAHFLKQFASSNFLFSKCVLDAAYKRDYVLYSFPACFCIEIDELKARSLSFMMQGKGYFYGPSRNLHLHLLWLPPKTSKGIRCASEGMLSDQVPRSLPEDWGLRQGSREFPWSRRLF